MTMVVPCRLITRQRSHMGLTDALTFIGDLFVREVLDLRIGTQTELGSDLARRRLTDSVDVGEPDLEPLLIREIDSGDACQLINPAFACASDLCCR